MKNKLLILFILSITGNIYSQTNTGRYKTSVIASLGTNFYSGDVCSGCANIGYGLSLSSRFKINRKILFRPEFEFQHISSKLDPESQLIFSNNLTGAALNFEFGLHKVNRGSAKRPKSELYLLLAPFVYHHNPYANINEKRTSLASLQTEDNVYSKLITGIRFGLNFQTKINSDTRIGFQIDYNFLLSDYIDDVSNNYIDYTILDPDRSIAVDPTQSKEIESKRGNDSKFDSLIKATVLLEFSFTRTLKEID